jgi:hypothetical protein
MDIGALFPEIKLSGREADQSLPASSDVKKTWIYTTPDTSSWLIA